MPEAPVAPFELSRMAAVHRTRLLGTPAEERFDRITRLARRMFDVPMACLDIVGEKLVWLKSVQGFDGLEGMRKDSYCHYAVLNDQICMVRDARADPRFHDSCLAQIWVFYAGVPLHFNGERVGVLCIGDGKPRDFDSDQLEALHDLGAMAEHELEVAALSEAQVILAHSNEELEMKARIDVLTHLWNRRAILELAEGELAAGANNSIAIVMIDIDHFKKINDTFGHPAGDEVLRSVAERLRRWLRPNDAVGRFGGEEFLAILSGVGPEEALQVCERIRFEVAKTTICCDQHKIPVSCSIGIAVSQAPADLDRLISSADGALYHAKESGRNRVELAPQPILRRSAHG